MWWNRHRWSWFVTRTTSRSTRRWSRRRHRRFPITITAVHTSTAVHITSIVGGFFHDDTARSCFQDPLEFLQKEHQDRYEVEPRQSFTGEDLIHQLQKYLWPYFPFRQIQKDLHLDRSRLSIIFCWDVERRIVVSSIRMQTNITAIRQSVDPSCSVMNALQDTITFVDNNLFWYSVWIQ